MALLGLSADISKIKRFAKNDNTIYVKECNSSGVVLTAAGSDSVWVCLGTLKGSQIEPITDTFIDKGDSGKRTVYDETVEAYEVTTTLMQRDENSRMVEINSAGKYYQIAIKGATLGASQEVWAGFGKFSLKWGPYVFGGEGQITNMKLVTLSNAATVTVVLDSLVLTATATLVIPPNQMVITDDV